MAMATITGKTKWFKMLGEPQENKFKSTVDSETGVKTIVRDWSFQLAVTSAEKVMFRQNKVKKHIKFDEELGDYVSIDYPEFGKKGATNPKVKIFDADGNPWPEDKWVGNLSTIKVDLELDKYSFQKGNEKIEGCRLIPRKITIVDHVPYQAKGTAKQDTKRVDNVNWSDDE